MTTGEKIRKRRLELKMTMEDLGNAIGVQKSAINKYEKGLVDMKGSTLAAIARVLNVPVITLLDDEDGEVPKTVEARSLARGIDTMPKAQREAILDMMMKLYPGIFEKEKDDDT